MAQATELKNIRAKKLEVGKTYVAMIWHTRVRREMVEVTVKELTADAVITDKLTAKTITKNRVTVADIDGKTKYVTWKVAAKKDYPLVKVADQVKEVKAPAKAKRTRKPLTAEQKARKNELARARRAAKKAAKV